MRAARNPLDFYIGDPCGDGDDEKNPLPTISFSLVITSASGRKSITLTMAPRKQTTTIMYEAGGLV